MLANLKSARNPLGTTNQQKTGVGPGGGPGPPGQDLKKVRTSKLLPAVLGYIYPHFSTYPVGEEKATEVSYKTLGGLQTTENRCCTVQEVLALGQHLDQHLQAIRAGSS